MVSGPEGCGTLDNYQESQLKVTTGTVQGRCPDRRGRLQVRWLVHGRSLHAAGDSDLGLEQQNHAGKDQGLGQRCKGLRGRDVLRKFEADVADLSITKQGYNEIDGKQSFIFTVTGPEGFSKKIVIQGNGTVVLTGLKIGEYTVTEDTAWSWRYTPRGGAVQKIELKPGITNTVNYMNDRTNDKWLDGNAYCKNVFGTIAETDSGN